MDTRFWVSLVMLGGGSVIAALGWIWLVHEILAEPWRRIRARNAKPLIVWDEDAR